MCGGNEWSGDVKQIVNLNSGISRRPAAAREKTMGTRRTSRLQKREYMDERYGNKRYGQREVCGISN